jgi:type I restriction enzyme M protein
MPPRPKPSAKATATPKTKAKEATGAVLGFEEKLWLAADKLRGSLDPAEYKHVVLGLIFLKYISDAFELRHAALVAEGDDPEDVDQYAAENVFWVPPKARWSALQKQAKLPSIGQDIDKAMEAIEQANESLRQTLPSGFARPALDKHRLGELIDLLSGIELHDPKNPTKDMLGRVYEYFLAKFASAEGRLGGDFYTPQSVVRVMVEMIEPTKGRVFDPCCGSGGMFVQSEKFVEAHGGNAGDDLACTGRSSTPPPGAWPSMNLAIRGIEANLGHSFADSFRDDLHPTLKADYVLANPPFNVSDWGGDRCAATRAGSSASRPDNNANFAWMQHILHHLRPQSGVGAVVMANGSMSSQQSGEGTIRQAMVEEDVVDCMVALPGPALLRHADPGVFVDLRAEQGRAPFRKRKGEVLFIDARKLGTLVDRVHRELSTRTSRASPAPTTRGAARKARASTPTCRASARAATLAEIASTATCSRRGATSAPRRSRRTASPSMRR